MDKPQMIIVGGPNGSGKSTFVYGVLRTRQNEYLGADAIAVEINPEYPESVAIQAGRLFVERLRDRIKHGENLIVESTLSGKSMIKQIESAIESGFETIVMFVFLDSADTCVARVRQRVSRGGHNVPESDIRRRYHRSLRNFWEKYRFTADQWILHQNSGDECIAVASGRDDNYIVYNEESMSLKQRVSRYDPKK